MTVIRRWITVIGCLANVEHLLRQLLDWILHLTRVGNLPTRICSHEGSQSSPIMHRRVLARELTRVDRSDTDD